MTETSLYDLLQDMLTLQAEVFTCVSEDICHKVLRNGKQISSTYKRSERRDRSRKYK